MTGGSRPPGAGPTLVELERRDDARPGRLLATLGGAGLLAGLLIVFVYRGTQPAIQAHKAEVLRQAVQEVLKAPDHYDTLYLYEGALRPRPPDGVDAQGLERVYLGYRGTGEIVGYAIAAGEPGFQDIIRLIFGYDAAGGQLLGMKVLESRETPGLGDKIEKDSAFVVQFDGAAPPLVGVKRRGGGTPGEIDMITGATISSRTVINIINHALERLGPALDAYRPERAQ